MFKDEDVAACEICGAEKTAQIKAANGPWHAICIKCADALIENLNEEGNVAMTCTGVMLNVRDVDIRGQITDMRQERA